MLISSLVFPEMIFYETESPLVIWLGRIKWSCLFLKTFHAEQIIKSLSTLLTLAIGCFFIFFFPQPEEHDFLPSPSL